MSYFLKQLSQKILIGGQPKNLCSRGTVHHKCHEASYDGYLFIGISPICSWHIERSRAWSGALLLDPHMCPRLSDLEKNAASLSQWLSTWQHCRFTGDSWETHMPGSQPPRSWLGWARYARCMTIQQLFGRVHLGQVGRGGWGWWRGAEDSLSECSEIRKWMAPCLADQFTGPQVSSIPSVQTSLRQMDTNHR